MDYYPKMSKKIIFTLTKAIQYIYRCIHFSRDRLFLAQCALLSLISVRDICAQTAGPRTKQKREINFKSFIKTRKMSFNNKIYQFVSFFLKIVVASTIKIYLRILYRFRNWVKRQIHDKCGKNSPFKFVRVGSEL